MKKLLPLFLAVLLIVAMVVPVSASEPTVDVTLGGVTFTLPAELDPSSTYFWLFSASIAETDCFELYATNVPLDFREISTSFYFSNNSGEDAVLIRFLCTPDGAWDEADLQINDIANGDELMVMKLYSRTLVQSSSPTCDGSTCPATDANKDNVCDDCGMTFAILRNYSPDGWPSDLPAPPSLDYMSYTVVEDDEGVWLFMVGDEVPYVYFNFETTTINFTMEGQYPGTNVQRYRLSGDEWAYNSIGSLRSQKFNGTYKFLYSSVDVYDLSGNPFFPEPLWLQVQGQTQGGVKNLAMTLGQTMGILVPFGVGLMALLVVLVLLAKKFRVFLP